MGRIDGGVVAVLGSVIGLLVVTGSLGAQSSRHSPSPPTVEALSAGIPPRPTLAAGGTAVVRRLTTLSAAARRGIVLEQLLAGNLPEFLRRLVPVEMSGRTPRGRSVRVVIYVMPDYLALGSDDDFVRIPLGFYSAVAVARRFGFVLPTRKMVDAIHRQARVRLRPIPLRPGPEMTSVRYFWEHHQRIEAQLGGWPRGVLVSGQKKDVVITNRLVRKAGRVAIYGWEYPDGTPIQPLSTVHGARYADYSHGVRLVSRTAFVDGRPRPIVELLEDETLAPLLSYEGAIRDVRLLMALSGPSELTTTAVVP